MVIHFPAAAHEEALSHIFASIAATASQFQFFQQVNMLTLQLDITNQIESSGQTGKSGANDVGRFLNRIRLFRSTRVSCSFKYT